MEEHIPTYKQPLYFNCDKYTLKKWKVVMKHKENHKQPCELKCNMCNYTNKNEV